MHDATAFVGEAVRKVYDRDSESLKKQGIEFACTLIFGGQIRGERCRLFQVYSAGNFIEAQDENFYFQIGEPKYGKPILDRVVTPATTLDEAAKCALVSMDSTLRSNLSVGLPLDLLCYEADSLRVTRFVTIGPDNEYFQMVSRTWGQRLKQAFVELPDPSWASAGTSQPVRAAVPPGLQPPGRTIRMYSIRFRMMNSAAKTPPSEAMNVWNARFAFWIGNDIGTETSWAPMTSFNCQPKPLSEP